jgi:hypothetical protein
MRRLPGERSLNLLSGELDRDAALQACLCHGPKAIYCGLLHYARARGWKDGTAYYAFIEIYGTEPRRQDRGEPKEPRAKREIG